ncbi:MAG TPA: cob(I)yrinic acid a,c-diamide adenosyltransferase [Puia sp.]|jgi:cob(I)alamin adenosyltransferase|nr:cob(I)yrinic acid a,c-diamide adenosyltransferase [Puia sp.]
MSSKIYTKTGDSGKTSLIGGTKVPKSHIRIQAYGTIDELNAFTGLLKDQLSEAHSRQLLLEVQDRLFTIGSSLACDPKKKIAMTIPDLMESDILLLENEIDLMNSRLPEMKSFILPGGHVTVSTAHICRTICRRAERFIVELDEKEPLVQPLIIKYLNRLSDYFFVLARWLGHLLGVPEVKWTPRQ